MCSWLPIDWNWKRRERVAGKQGFDFSKNVKILVVKFL
jgi:hypothetical protein